MTRLSIPRGEYEYQLLRHYVVGFLHRQSCDTFRKTLQSSFVNVKGSAGWVLRTDRLTTWRLPQVACRRLTLNLAQPRIPGQIP
jgi:hypothetical protein